MSARCPRTQCGHLLEARRNVFTGVVTFVCAPCERNARGICRDCPAPLEWKGSGRKPMRCPKCAYQRNVERSIESSRRRWRDEKARVSRLQRARRTTPEYRARQREYHRRWRERNRDPLARKVFAAKQRDRRARRRAERLAAQERAA